MSKQRKILATNALPYANGELHLGHLVGSIQGDIWVRLQKMHGHDCLYVCGSDGHGTPIMISAEKLGVSPEALITRISQSQDQDFADFLIKFDNFYTTHSVENQELVTLIFKRHLDKGNIVKRTITQLFDPVKKMFLPDRYVKGECPNCGARDQYGDNCEVCGATYLPTDLKNAYSTLSGATPVEKESEHYFFKLNNYTDYLKEWTLKGHLQEQVSKKLDEWFKDGLREWDISRDAPYFGFKIPGEDNKYFYVWLDAPVGYIASFKNYVEKHREVSFADYWEKSDNTELHHFIGKDIIYFHALFWPAILKGADFRTPNKIYVNGFLTIDGQKMSKSRGTFIKARTYLNHLPAEYLRYYFATKLSDRIEDLDMHYNDFTQRVNADLVGKFINIASRCASFLNKYYDGRLSEVVEDTHLLKEFAQAGNEIAQRWNKLEYSHAVREIMALADKANQYIDEKKPWLLIKDEAQKNVVQEVCTVGINLFRILMIYLKPVLPGTAEKVEAFLQIAPLNWHDKDTLLLNHTIQTYQPLMQRIDPKQIEEMKMSINKDVASNEEAKPATEGTTEKAEKTEKTEKAKSNLVSITEFAKLDLRVAKIVEAENIPEAEKLVKLKVDVGGETKQIFAGIKSAYTAEDLIGKQVVIVANLEPRKMRFGVSEGMVLCAEGNNDLFIIMPDEGAAPGMKVK